MILAKYIQFLGGNHVRILATLIFVSAAMLLVNACGGGATPAPNPASPPVVVAPTTPPVVPPVVPPSEPAGDVVSVSLQDPGGSGAYLFDPSELTFSLGDTINLEMTSEDEFHTFTVDDLGIDVLVDAGGTETLTFTFDKAGTFDLICIPHEALGMVGTITVK